MHVDFGGGAVVVTGGTRGLGKALGMEFARANASVYLTHRWGSVAEAELLDEFAGAGLAAPHIVESDASDPADARTLLQHVARAGTPLVALVNNVAFAQVAGSIDALRRGSIELSLRYSTWPLLELLHAAREVLGHYPRYALAISTDGGFTCHPGYAMVGIAKAALETLCRYLAIMLRGEGVRVNAVRCGALDTASSRATFGDAAFTAALGREGVLLDPHDIARACVALCSGMMDSVTGQVITVDEGFSLISPVVFMTGSDWPQPFPPPTDAVP